MPRPPAPRRRVARTSAGPAVLRNWRLRAGAGLVLLLALLVPGLVYGPALLRELDRQWSALTGTIELADAVERIVMAESRSDPNARNRRSSATGAGQFLDQTWLALIRAHRADLLRRGEKEALELRRDPALAREMTARFLERNAAMLRRQCLPVTLGAVYLAHFAGGAGAVALLSAPADADARGGGQGGGGGGGGGGRAPLSRGLPPPMGGGGAGGGGGRGGGGGAIPFLEGLTVADLKARLDRKLRGPEIRLAGMMPIRSGHADAGLIVRLPAAAPCRRAASRT
ncbi:MAG: lytic transglycosylase domain-containing protein [Xanthobacteraceae bacterium]|nr:lytic transglycosylase domain-containing protein [Xanthobacteraceae bacterium]